MLIILDPSWLSSLHFFLMLQVILCPPSHSSVTTRSLSRKYSVRVLCSAEHTALPRQCPLPKSTTLLLSTVIGAIPQARVRALKECFVQGCLEHSVPGWEKRGTGKERRRETERGRESKRATDTFLKLTSSGCYMAVKGRLFVLLNVRQHWPSWRMYPFYCHVLNNW